MRRAGLREVDATVRRRGEYSSDASNYRVVPKVVVFPRHVDEVCTAMDVARGEGVPVTARGGGTSIAGNAVGTGIVLDFSRHMNRVLSVDADDRSALVEPGVVLDSVTAAASAFGLRFGPDPSTHSRATIGGSIGNNVCGSRTLRYGRTADNVETLDVVLSSGERINARRFGADGLAGAPLPLGSALAALVDSNADLIRREFGRFGRQVSGYSIEHLLPERDRTWRNSWSGVRARSAWPSVLGCAWSTRPPRLHWLCSDIRTSRPLPTPAGASPPPHRRVGGDGCPPGKCGARPPRARRGPAAAGRRGMAARRNARRHAGRSRGHCQEGGLGLLLSRIARRYRSRRTGHLEDSGGWRRPRWQDPRQQTGLAGMGGCCRSAGSAGPLPPGLREPPSRPRPRRPSLRPFRRWLHPRQNRFPLPSRHPPFSHLPRGSRCASRRLRGFHVRRARGRAGTKRASALHVLRASP